MKLTKYSANAIIAILGFSALTLLLLAGLLVYLIAMLYWAVNPDKAPSMPALTLPALPKPLSPEEQKVRPGAVVDSQKQLSTPEVPLTAGLRPYKWDQVIKQAAKQEKITIKDLANDQSATDRLGTHQLTWGAGNG